MISLKNFESNLLKTDKKSHKHWYLQHWIITIKKTDGYENIYSVNLLYLFFNHANAYIEEKMKINT